MHIWSFTTAEYAAMANEIGGWEDQNLLLPVMQAIARGCWPTQLKLRSENSDHSILLEDAEIRLRDILERHVVDSSRRQPCARSAPQGPQATTRDCLDPWRYMEIDTDGGAKPCCAFPMREYDCSSPQPNSWNAMRDRATWQYLRRQLFSGHLSPFCTNCNIRKPIPTSEFRAKVEALGAADPLAALPMTELRIDVTGRCNLRCDYCLVSSPGYDGYDMPQSQLEGLVRVIKDHPPVNVFLNGHGETTFHRGWSAIAGSLLEAGHRLHMTTNLSLNYSDEEVALLSRFSTIQISLDSHDEGLMRRIRKPVRVAKLLERMAQIRDVARHANHTPPDFSFSVGLYDPSIWTLADFVDVICDQQARSVTFWNLVTYPHQRLCRALYALSIDKQIEARGIMEHAAYRLGQAGIDTDFAGGIDSFFAK